MAGSRSEVGECRTGWVTMGASSPLDVLIVMAGFAIIGGGVGRGMMPSLGLSCGSAHMAGIAGLRILIRGSNCPDRGCNLTTGALMTRFTGGMAGGGISDNRTMTIHTERPYGCGDKMLCAVAPVVGMAGGASARLSNGMTERAALQDVTASGVMAGRAV